MNEETFIPPGAAETLEWITVLSAAGFNYRLERDGQGGWLLHVPLSQAPAAWVELCAFENERLAPVPPEPPRRAADPADRQSAWAAFWLAYVLILFYLWTGPYDAARPLLQAGCADAGKIMAGEWWRNLTALTLHSGIPHLLANAFFILVLGQAVMHAFGRGLGLMLMLGGGFTGNAVAACVSGPVQISVGASTMCFAALGSMSLHQTVHAWRRWRRWLAVWRRAWLPLAAGLALLGIMGTGEQSDLAGHAFGFLAGALLALPFTVPAVPRLSPCVQWLLTGLAVLLPLASWALAIYTQGLVPR